MERLSAFFAKFKNLQAPERTVKQAAVRAVHDVLGVAIDENDVDVKRDTVVLRVPSVVKSEVALKEREVLDALHAALAPAPPRIKKIR